MMAAGKKTATTTTMCYAAEKGTEKVLENTENECLKKCLPKVISFEVDRSVGDLEENCDSLMNSSKSAMQMKEKKEVVKEIVKDVTTHTAKTGASYVARTKTEELVKDEEGYMNKYLPGIVECATERFTSDVCKIGFNSGGKTKTEILQEVKNAAKDTAKDVTKNVATTGTSYAVQEKTKELVKDQEGYMKECLPGQISYAVDRCTSEVCDIALNYAGKTTAELMQTAKTAAKDTAKDIIKHTATTGTSYVVQKKTEDQEGYMKECLPGQISYAAGRCTSEVCDIAFNSAGKARTEIMQSAKNAANDTAKDLIKHTAITGTSYVVRKKTEECVKDQKGYMKECLPDQINYAAGRCTSEVCDIAFNSAGKARTEIMQSAKNAAKDTAKDIIQHTATTGTSYVVRKKTEEFVEDKNGFMKYFLPNIVEYAANRCTSEFCNVLCDRFEDQETTDRDATEKDT